jgi:hypothetical protein
MGAHVDTRIMVYWSLYVVMHHLSQPMWSDKFCIERYSKMLGLYDLVMGSFRNVGERGTVEH